MLSQISLNLHNNFSNHLFQVYLWSYFLNCTKFLNILKLLQRHVSILKRHPCRIPSSKTFSSSFRCGSVATFQETAFYDTVDELREKILSQIFLWKFESLTFTGFCGKSSIVMSNDSHKTIIMRTKLIFSWRKRVVRKKTLPFIANLSTAGRYEFFISIRDWNFGLIEERRRKSSKSMTKNKRI